MFDKCKVVLLQLTCSLVCLSIGFSESVFWIVCIQLSLSYSIADSAASVVMVTTFWCIIFCLSCGFFPCWCHVFVYHCLDVIQMCTTKTSIKLKITVRSSLASWARKLLNQSEIHSFRPHIKRTWHWNPIFIETTSAWLILLGLFLFYNVTYQKEDQDNMKSGPHSLKGGLTISKGSVLIKVYPTIT